MSTGPHLSHEDLVQVSQVTGGSHVFFNGPVIGDLRSSNSVLESMEENKDGLRPVEGDSVSNLDQSRPDPLVHQANGLHFQFVEVEVEQGGGVTQCVTIRVLTGENHESLGHQSFVLVVLGAKPDVLEKSVHVLHEVDFVYSGLGPRDIDYVKDNLFDLFVTGENHSLRPPANIEVFLVLSGILCSDRFARVIGELVKQSFGFAEQVYHSIEGPLHLANLWLVPDVRVNLQEEVGLNR